MSDATQEMQRLSEHSLTEPIPAASLDGAAHDHPADKRYWLLALLLALITAAEVSTYSNPGAWGSHVTTALLIMASIKFVAVTLVFMHLYFDNRFLTYVFYAGLVLALMVYLAALSSMHFF
jgi:cytochrome c oxidase subunit 4